MCFQFRPCTGKNQINVGTLNPISGSNGICVIKEKVPNKLCVFFYGYSGKHKGLTVNVRAYIEEGKLVQIVYEEVDELNNMKSTISYYRK